jgi:ADP-dependent phosphofructokinase/glucokinase
VVSLADRSAAQLSVLDPAIGLTAGGDVRPARDIAPAGETTKPPHFIVEYAAGTRWRGGVVPRSSRFIVRLACDGLELDDDFAALGPIGAGAGLVSGMNGLAADDVASHEWLTGVLARWRTGGPPMIHLELAEYPRRGDLTRTLDRYGRYVQSLGLNLTELFELHPAADPARAALAVAEHYALDRVCVHADDWALAVHRGDPGEQVAALRTANLLAAARARAGAPTADLTISPAAVFTADLPAAGPLGGGRRADVVPVPWLARPAATVGLGDTFVAGLLLSACMSTAGQGGAPETTGDGQPGRDPGFPPG